MYLEPMPGTPAGKVSKETAESSLRSDIAIGLEQALRGELLNGEKVFEALGKRIGHERGRRK